MAPTIRQWRRNVVGTTSDGVGGLGNSDVAGTTDRTGTTVDTMSVVRLCLLLVAVGGVAAAPRRVPKATIPLIMTAAAVLGGVVDVVDIVDGLHPVLPAVAFLLAAVPLAALLDEVGLFEAVANRIEVGGHFLGSLWAVAAATTVTLNLDTTIVLLTPLYARIARRHGLPVAPIVLIPALLASLASSALPVSNLTNLVIAHELDLAATQFVVHLGAPTLVAILIGWWRFRSRYADVLARVGPAERAAPTASPLAWRVGLPVTVAVLAGFTVGDAVGLQAWSVALVGDLVLVVALRRVPRRVVPIDTAVMVLCLAVLAFAAAPTLPLSNLIAGGGPGGEVTSLAMGVAGSVFANNLPATLVALPHVGGAGGPWSFLLGVNLGPVLAIWGSLAGLLWLDAARRADPGITLSTYHRSGWAIGGPALLGAFATRLLLVPLCT